MPGGEEAQARTFYVGLLGMTELEKPSELAPRGGVWFRSGDIFLHLRVDPDFRPAARAHPALRCVDYRALVEKLGVSGISTVSDGRLVEGRPHCCVYDPFGNRIELIG
ncbi:MAG TPA: glyoxalase [Candidatus Nitrosotalea sp.]|nr:glyoxalase [Candidatus Nitrosotalea sp.]